jgi:type IV pilus assembly protein PilO
MKVGKIQSMPWYLRLTLLVVIAGLMYGAFWYFVTKGTRAQTRTLNEQIAQLLKQNAQAQVASQRLNEFRAIYKARQEEYDELKALLPEQRELTMVLQGLQDRARTSGLVFRKFTPKDDIQQENYSGKKIEVGVTSSFASLRSFFEQLAHYQRIVSITNFELNQMDEQTLNQTVEARFDLTAYYVSAEKLQRQPAQKTKGSGGQAATTPATQPAK